MELNVPNFLTMLRIILIPVLVLVFYLPFSWAPITTAVLFAVAAITDWLDGLFARILNQTSAFGSFLDPVADKLIVATVLVLLVGDPKMLYLTLPAAVIIGREIVVSALREWMAEIGKRASVAVSLYGKFKTVLQMLALVVLLATRQGEFSGWQSVGYILLYLSALLTLGSMYIYLRKAWPDLAFSHSVDKV